MEQIVGLKELRGNINKYAKKVKDGNVLIIVRKSKPLFKLTPLAEEEWEEVIDFTKVKKGGVDVKEILARL